MWFLYEENLNFLNKNIREKVNTYVIINDLLSNISKVNYKLIYINLIINIVFYDNLTSAENGRTSGNCNESAYILFEEKIWSPNGVWKNNRLSWRR